MKVYIDHTKEGQNGIYFFTDESIVVVSFSEVEKGHRYNQERYRHSEREDQPQKREGEDR